MKTLRVLRNIAALTIIAVSLIASRARAAGTTAYTCYNDGSTTIGYNCTFNSDGSCSSSKCKAGEPCNNYICGNPISDKNCHPKGCGY